jgi:hypothetical protein
MQFLYVLRLQIGTLLAADRIRRASARAGQAGRATTQNMSCPRHASTGYIGPLEMPLGNIA